MSTVTDQQSSRETETGTRFPVPRAAGLAAVLGTWIFWSGVFLTGFGWIVTNNVLTGVVIATMAAYTAARPSGGRLPALVGPLVVALFGAWTVAAAFVLEVQREILFWSNIVAGALVTVLAVVSVYGVIAGTET